MIRTRKPTEDEIREAREAVEKAEAEERTQKIRRSRGAWSTPARIAVKVIKRERTLDKVRKMGFTFGD